MNDVAVRARSTPKVRRMRVVTTLVSPLLRRNLLRLKMDMTTRDNLLVNIKIKNNTHYPQSSASEAYRFSRPMMFTVNSVPLTLA